MALRGRADCRIRRAPTSTQAPCLSNDPLAVWLVDSSSLVGARLAAVRSGVRVLGVAACGACARCCSGSTSSGAHDATLSAHAACVVFVAMGAAFLKKLKGKELRIWWRDEPHQWRMPDLDDLEAMGPRVR